jgi:hypothetical protein
VRPADRLLAQRFDSTLDAFDRDVRPLPGIDIPAQRAAFLEQLVESERRVRYFAVLREHPRSAGYADPTSDIFDPISGSLVKSRAGDIEEAFWLAFYAVHFGKNLRGGWRYAKEVYGALGNGNHWTWVRTSANPTAFRNWLTANEEHIRRDAPPGGFSNHRKYQSLSGASENGTGAAFESYINWIGPAGHVAKFNAALQEAHNSPTQTFANLYRSMRAVRSFGRLGKFDYLTMIGKLGLAPIRANSTYMTIAKGPITGARLLFGQDVSPKTLDQWLIELDVALNVGMQVLEDALCNWQKSPAQFVPFRG